MATGTYGTSGSNPIAIPCPDAIIDRFWGLKDSLNPAQKSKAIHTTDLSPYLEYYRRQWDIIAADTDGRYVTVRSHGDILDIIQRIRQNESKESILEYLAARTATTHTTEAYDNSVNLAA